MMKLIEMFTVMPWYLQSALIVWLTVVLIMLYRIIISFFKDF